MFEASRSSFGGGRDRVGAAAGKGKRERGSRGGFASNDPESMLLDMPEHIHPGGTTVETKMVRFYFRRANSLSRHVRARRTLG